MPLAQVPGQVFDALVDHAGGWRGRSCLRRSSRTSRLPFVGRGRKSRSLVGLCILVALTALVDPGFSDPLWIAGVYDGADGDDLAGTLEVGVAPWSVISPAPSDTRPPFLARPLVEPPRAAFSPAFRIRPPPFR
jgi:hypothetical protein